MAKTRKINPRQQKFVEEYLRHGNARNAATAAGYSPKSAKDLATKFVVQEKSPAVTQALNEARAKSITLAAYNADVAMTECEDAIQFARETENANAYVKAVELKSKLKGLLVEKLDVRQVGFQIQISGIDGPPTPTTSTEKEVASDAQSAIKPEIDPFS